MRSVTVRSFALLMPLALAAGCPADLTEVCDLPGAAPDVEEGQGSAQQNGEPFSGPATWSPGTSAAVNIGLLTMVVAKDTTGADFDALLADGAVPICVPQGERSDTSGNAALNESPSFVSDATHTGNVAILSFDNDVLVGRFAFDLVNSESGDVLSFTDGVFSATRQGTGQD